MSKGDIKENLQDIIEDADEIFRIIKDRDKSKQLYEIALEKAIQENEKIEEFYIKGKIALIEKNWKKALENFESVLNINPNHIKSLNYKGMALGCLENYEDALKWYDKAIELDSKYETAWNNKGVALFHLDRYEDALKCYDKAIELDSKYARTWYNKSLALSKMKKYDEALECIEKCIAIDPNYAWTWNGKAILFGRMGEHKKALEYAEKAIGLDPNYSNAWNTKGTALKCLKEYTEALRCYNKAIKLDNNNFKALTNKGLLYGDMGKHEDALKWLDSVLKINPENKHLLYSKGVAFFELGKYEDAIECYNKVLEIDPGHYQSLNNKGIILSRLGKYDEAIECYNKSLKVSYYNNHRSLNNKGIVFYKLGNVKKAIDCYDKALEIKPDYYKALTNKGIAFFKLSNFKKAIDCYDKVLEIKPDYYQALTNKGVALTRLGKYEEAITYLDKTLKINPKYDLAYASKGFALSKLGKNEEAIKCIDKGLQINPGSSILKFRRNSILMNTEKFDEAHDERKKLYSEEKENIKKSELSKEEKYEKILEINVQEEVITELKDDYKTILDAKNKNEKKLALSLEPREKPIQDNFLMVLRRWNSYTPTIPTGTDSNLGGGYFIRWCGKGIVIDPGFDFLDNFFDSGLVIDDIDAVIISHAHIDHCVDFESLLTLIFEYNEKNSKKKKIDVFMNLGTIKKLLGWIPLDEEGDNAKINHIYPLEKGVTYNPEGYNIKITATDAMHNELLSKSYSVGVILDLYGIEGYTASKPFKIGYTSDTGHSGYIEKQYDGVDIIISHLGSVEEDDFNPAISDAEGNIADTEGNHLMLKGVISTIYKSKANLAIVSEYGEELGEHRITIVNALNKVFKRNKMARCLTGDIGLKVKIPDLKIKCCYCSDNHEKYFKPGYILEDIDPLNKDKKAIVYFCKKCKRSHELLKRMNDQ